MTDVRWQPSRVRFLIIFVFRAFLIATDCTAGERKIGKTRTAITADQVRPHIEFLASPELQGRRGKGAEAAAKYIVRQFEKLGLRPLFSNQSYRQIVPGPRSDRNQPTENGRNIGAFIPGQDSKLRDEYVIIGAHFDHLGVRRNRVYRGADDNASGVSMLIEVARQFREQQPPPRRTIVFVGFDFEERMLWGSRWFVAHPPWPIERVKFFLTADMIGRSLGNLPLSTVFVMGSERSLQLKTVLDQVGSPKGLNIARLGIDLIGTRSDYAAFRDQKIPFLFFSTGEHPDYHTPNDVPERINFDQVAKISDTVFKIVSRVANLDSAPKWIENLKPDIDEARSIYSITSLLLDAADSGKYKLTDQQRLVVTQTRIMTKQIVARGKMSKSERKWLVRMSQLLLFSVF